jgi:beta-lactamase regulating signal transducer with metallopeptidase domain/protocatechuate 3,4-dioxygenase beta subunit
MIDVSSLSVTCLNSLLDASVKALALALLAGLWLGVGRVRSPALRHAAWATVLCGMLGVPVLSLALPGVVLPLLPSSRSGGEDTAAVSTTSEGAPAGAVALNRIRDAAVGQAGLLLRAGHSPGPAGTVEPVPVPRVRLSLWAVGFLGYLTVVVVLLGRFLVGIAACRRIVRASQVLAPERLTEGCSPSLGRALSRRRVEFRACPTARVPLTLGWLRPKILLPSDWPGWCPSKREAALAHELAHVERRDALFAALGAVNQCLYWFHPMAWLLPKRLAALSERTCDDRAITLTGAPIPYARHLLEFAAPLVDHRRRVAFGVLSMADGGDLGSRINALLDRGRAISPPLTRRAWLMLMAVAFVIVPTLAVLRIGPRALGGTDGAAAEKAQPTSETETDVIVRGRVLGPDGRPVSGAKLYLAPSMGYLNRPYPSPECATSGPDGRFRFTAPKETFDDRTAVVTAAAANSGVAWMEIPAGGQRDDLALRLVDDDVPITGQIVDLEGKPVQGATLRIVRVNAAPKEDLNPWLEAAKGKKGYARGLEQRYLSRLTAAPSSKVTTDAAGRFRLTGIGRDRLVVAQLDGPAIASEHLHILTRPGETINLRDEPDQIISYYTASFRHVAGPTKPIVGVVRDKDTNRPLAGITIRSDKLPGKPFRGVGMVETVTDAEGRYRLTGMPKGEGNLGRFGPGMIRAVPGSGQPYVLSAKEVPDSPGLDPVTVDFELKRGVLIEGKITDKVTGNPLRAGVKYFALIENPNLSAYDGFSTYDYSNLQNTSTSVETKADGSYQVAGLPGPGLVAVVHNGPYLKAPDRDDEYGINQNVFQTAPDLLMPPIRYNAVARIDPAKGVSSVNCDVTLDQGWTFTGTVLGPEGTPLAGARAFGLTDREVWEQEGMSRADFAVRQFNPRRPREVLLQHTEKGLIGVASSPKFEDDSIVVQMRPGAVVTARLLDADGRPWAGVKLHLDVQTLSKGKPRWNGYSPEILKTDQEGRLRLEALLPGYAYRLTHYFSEERKSRLIFGEALRSGQTNDLGDVRMTME